MNLEFKKVNNDKYNEIEVSFDNKKISFNLTEDCQLNNNIIAEMLLNIATNISNGTFNPKNDIITIPEEELEELKDLYVFIYGLFDDFIKTFIVEYDRTNSELQQKIEEKIEDIKSNL